MRLIQLTQGSLDFPPPEMALQEPNGLLATGGDLCPERLLAAYHRGIFPWFSPEDPILWWSPDPRAVLKPEEFHISRSMKRFHQHTPYRVTLNHAFYEVLQGCASERQGGTWITPEVKQAWQTLFQLKHAHSVEVWENDTLTGGIYGLALGQLFCGESMFSRSRNASKTALMVFCDYFHQQGGKLIDCQILNPHTASLGAKEIAREHYLNLLKQLMIHPLPEHCWQAQTLF
ncbi:leucyl/phenylalanyl-tRNA--protein transferase [Enterobacteriaceae bacterium LUAb1]